MKETSKLSTYRQERGYDVFFKGLGIDIGAGDDVLTYPGCYIQYYDREQGDAQDCANLADDAFDFVYSSHCLEHMRDPYLAFRNWLRICKPGGYLVVAIPHEVFYEKCHWPSQFNQDHKTSWSLEWKSNLPKSIHAPTFLKKFNVEIIRLETLLLGFDFNRFEMDQTLQDAICQIEFVVRKKVDSA